MSPSQLRHVATASSVCALREVELTADGRWGIDAAQRHANGVVVLDLRTADPTVAFQEALGFYNALRFNDKTAVLLAYPGEGHGLRGLANRRDLTIRYFQFFDHYLRGAPAARWMTEGVPFLEKDLRRDASKELVESGTATR